MMDKGSIGVSGTRKEMGRFFVVIAVHNRIKFTRECMECLGKQTLCGFQTIIVDDGSTDGTSEMIQKYFPDVILLHGDGDLWWAGATNKGVQLALEQGAEYIITLNDDTLPDPTWIADMVKWIETYPNALIGSSAIASETGKLVYGGERIAWLKAKMQDLLQVLPESKKTGLHWVSHFPGRGLLIPVKVFHKIGLYDAKKFPHTMADYDFTFRSRDAGYEIYCNYDARLVIHSEQSDTIALRREKSVRRYFKHLFSMKGGANLRFFIIHAVKNCPKRYMPFYLVAGLMRRVFGYLRDWSCGR